MSASFTSVQIERLKREAKAMHRASPLSHSQALDHIAVANGYTNWSLLMKDNPGCGISQTCNTPKPFPFTRMLSEMRAVLRKVPEARNWGGPTRSELAKLKVADTAGQFVSPQNVVEFAIGYMECLLQVPRYRVYTASQVYWEMRLWLPYCCHKIGAEDAQRILVNRHYKPAGQITDAWAKYADFPSMRATLTGDQCRRFAPTMSREGYLFNDGCAPWSSRADADAYLVRLGQLRDALNAPQPRSHP